MGWWRWLAVAAWVGAQGAVQAQDRWVPGAETRRVTCESINGRYRTCPVGNHGGVRLERQLSDSRCIEGRTWGVEDQGIWVDKGCRGVFLVMAGPVTLTCRSVNFKYQFCQVDTRGGVRLQRQLSDSRCIEGRTWGYDRQGIWVDRGCAAEFAIGIGETAPPPPADRLIRCESVNNRRVVCPVETRRATVTLERQLSRARCIQGQTWGYDNGGIWVTNGCRGDFRVSSGSVGELVVCRSHNGLFTRCPVDTRKGVEFRRSLGRGVCRRDQTWGYDRQGIWVTQGCEGEFLVRR